MIGTFFIKKTFKLNSKNFILVLKYIGMFFIKKFSQVQKNFYFYLKIENFQKGFI